MERAKQSFMSSGRQLQKSLEKATAERIMNAMMGTTERRFREPTTEEVEALTMEGMEKSVLKLLHAGGICHACSSEGLDLDLRCDIALQAIWRSMWSATSIRLNWSAVSSDTLALSPPGPLTCVLPRSM